ncbi:unnamed protein product [Phaeothamnion confervicola]
MRPSFRCRTAAMTRRSCSPSATVRRRLGSLPLAPLSNCWLCLVPVNFLPSESVFKRCWSWHVTLCTLSVDRDLSVAAVSVKVSVLKAEPFVPPPWWPRPAPPRCGSTAAFFRCGLPGARCGYGVSGRGEWTSSVVIGPLIIAVDVAVPMPFPLAAEAGISSCVNGSAVVVAERKKGGSGKAPSVNRFRFELQAGVRATSGPPRQVKMSRKPAPLSAKIALLPGP